MTTTQIDRLARVFLRGLRKEIGAAKFRKARVLNADETNPMVCHSHDFCDANMVMLAAFESEGLDIPETDEDERAWGLVWDRAKAIMQCDELAEAYPGQRIGNDETAHYRGC